MSGVKLNRSMRNQSVPDALSSPLPLYKLPIEKKVAKTGCTERLAELPVIRHIFTSPNEAETILIPSFQSIPFNEEEEDETIRTEIYDYYDNTMTHEETATTLQFNSVFESGNLLRVDRVRYPNNHPTQYESYHQYELWLHPDINNSAYRQWFYFSVENGQPNIEYRFSIVNLAKSAALFKIGLQPVVYSEMDAIELKIGWIHQGYNITYETSTRQEGSNTLSFTYTFKRKEDRVYFACIQPYTYTDLQEYLDLIENDPIRSLVCRRTELCQTLAHNTCDLLTITASGKDGQPIDSRRVIVISARVHPGESNSSFMMKGMIDYLTSNTSGAIVLRKNFIFKIIPMLNPDGVINGNTRVNLAGWDLNRKWAYPVEKLFPTIFHLKKLITIYQRPQPNGIKRVIIYCDLHGHSIQRNIFTYGCLKTQKKKKLKINTKNDPRVFPMLVAKSSDMFSFNNCNFKIQSSKRNTARVVVNQELGVINSYTLEASFCGPDFGIKKNTQFSIYDLETMGFQWCRSLLVYFELTQQVTEEENSCNLPTQNISIKNDTNKIDIIIPTYVPEGEFDVGILNACESEVSCLEDFIIKDDCHDCDSDISEAADDAIAPNHQHYGNISECRDKKKLKKKIVKKIKKFKKIIKKKKKGKNDIKNDINIQQNDTIILKQRKGSSGAIVVPDTKPLAGLLLNRKRYELDLNIDLPTNVYLQLKRPASSSSVPSVSPKLAVDGAEYSDTRILVRPTSS